MNTVWILIVEHEEEIDKEIILDVAGAYVDRPHASLLIGAIREYTGIDLTRTYRQYPEFIGKSLENDTVFKVGHYKFTLYQVEVEE